MIEKIKILLLLLYDFTCKVSLGPSSLNRIEDWVPTILPRLTNFCGTTTLELVVSSNSLSDNNSGLQNQVYSF